MTVPVQSVHPKPRAPAFLPVVPRFALWQFLACGIMLATCLADSDGRKIDSSKAEPADNLAIAEQLKGVFDAGFQVGPRSAQQAQERMARVRRVAPREPRIDYCYGLVLARQSQIKLASVQFEAAIAQGGPPLWPAWKAAIWSHLVEKRYEPGMNRLVEFAILVHDGGNPESAADEHPAAGGREVSELQKEAACWIGQILEAVAQLPDASTFKDLIEDRQSRALDALGDELSLSVEDGRELLRARALELGLAADAARVTAAQLARRRKWDKEMEAIGRDKGNTPQTKEEWKKWIDDSLVQTDKQLSQMDRDFQTLTQRADALERSYSQAVTQLVAIKTNISVAHHNGGQMMIGLLKEQLVACSNQITAYQVEYDFVEGQVATVAQHASGVADRRNKAIDRYEKITGDAIKTNPDLDKWTGRLNAKRPKLAAKPSAKLAKKGSADKNAGEKKRPPAFKSLMPLDLEHERDEVLASFGLRPSSPGELPNSGEKPDLKSARSTAATEK